MGSSLSLPDDQFRRCVPPGVPLAGRNSREQRGGVSAKACAQLGHTKLPLSTPTHLAGSGDVTLGGRAQRSPTSPPRMDKSWALGVRPMPKPGSCGPRRTPPREISNPWRKSRNVPSSDLVGHKHQVTRERAGRRRQVRVQSTVAAAGAGKSKGRTAHTARPPQAPQWVQASASCHAWRWQGREGWAPAAAVVTGRCSAWCHPLWVCTGVLASRCWVQWQGWCARIGS